MLKSVSMLENQFVGDVQRLKGVSFASETRLKCVCLCVTFHILKQLSGSDLLKGASSSAQASSLFLCLPLSAHLPSLLPNLTYKSSAHNNLMGNNWIFFSTPHHHHLPASPPPPPFDACVLASVLVSLRSSCSALVKFQHGSGCGQCLLR